MRGAAGITSPKIEAVAVVSGDQRTALFEGWRIDLAILDLRDLADRQNAEIVLIEQSGLEMPGLSEIAVIASEIGEQNAKPG